ncbi:RdgB/HAM1 family non-canonical purine NTP pyrophosphatase [Candidatus Kapabacteria bacterium]|nr:RdgB/HAM1 family non-canonical purine NTP pyrophosphatase [Candidatus Kapabacteria bacterium]
MNNKILLATGNKNKILEIEQSIKLSLVNYKIISPKEINLEHINPIENATSLEGNAKIKAHEFFKASNLPSLADDTGLEVDSLDGEPGVFSARFAGINASSQQNRLLLLDKLAANENRKARFRTVFCFYDGNATYFFEGICEGTITYEQKGDSGFGYDPIFIPENYSTTFAEMDADLKNKISHRGKAVRNFVSWLKDYKS